MPTQNNNTITYFDSALMANDVYKENAVDRGVNGWEPDVITGVTGDFDSGLQI